MTYKQLIDATKRPIDETPEHHPQRARFLRAELRSMGKELHQLSLQELLDVNKKVDEQCHAEND